MSTNQLNELWELTRKNEKTIAVLQAQFGAQSEDLKQLKEDNDAMRAILNQAIGAKTLMSFAGAVVVAVITWAITYFSAKQ